MILEKIQHYSLKVSQVTHPIIRYIGHALRTPMKQRMPTPNSLLDVIMFGPKKKTIFI